MIPERFVRWRNRGFVGPRYRGVLGTLRFLFQELVVRNEIVFGWCRESLPEILDHSAKLLFLTAYDDIRPYSDIINAEYHEGYTHQWASAFGWGEELALLLKNDMPVGFGWVQTGHESFSGCHWGLVGPGEYRVGRVGVLPSKRRRGYNTLFYRLLLTSLAERGANRVYVECFKDNVPSVRAILRGGFRPIGEIRVLGRLAGGYVRWLRFGPEIGIPDVEAGNNTPGPAGGEM